MSFINQRTDTLPPVTRRDVNNTFAYEAALAAAQNQLWALLVAPDQGSPAYVGVQLPNSPLRDERIYSEGDVSTQQKDLADTESHDLEAAQNSLQPRHIMLESNPRVRPLQTVQPSQYAEQCTEEYDEYQVQPAAEERKPNHSATRLDQHNRPAPCSEPYELQLQQLQAIKEATYEAAQNADNYATQRQRIIIGEGVYYNLPHAPPAQPGQQSDQHAHQFQQIRAVQEMGYRVLAPLLPFQDQIPQIQPRASEHHSPAIAQIPSDAHRDGHYSFLHMRRALESTSNQAAVPHPPTSPDQVLEQHPEVHTNHSTFSQSRKSNPFYQQLQQHQMAQQPSFNQNQNPQQNQRGFQHRMPEQSHNYVSHQRHRFKPRHGPQQPQQPQQPQRNRAQLSNSGYSGAPVSFGYGAGLPPAVQAQQLMEQGVLRTKGGVFFRGKFVQNPK